MNATKAIIVASVGQNIKRLGPLVYQRLKLKPGQMQFVNILNPSQNIVRACEIDDADVVIDMSNDFFWQIRLRNALLVSEKLKNRVRIVELYGETLEEDLGDCRNCPVNDHNCRLCETELKLPTN